MNVLDARRVSSGLVDEVLEELSKYKMNSEEELSFCEMPFYDLVLYFNGSNDTVIEVRYDYPLRGSAGQYLSELMRKK